MDAAEVIYKNENVMGDISGFTLGAFEERFERLMIDKVRDVVAVRQRHRRPPLRHRLADLRHGELPALRGEAGAERGGVREPALEERRAPLSHRRCG
jgi:hypothetical protein